jgi:hypothetical protein
MSMSRRSIRYVPRATARAAAAVLLGLTLAGCGPDVWPPDRVEAEPMPGPAVRTSSLTGTGTQSDTPPVDEVHYVVGVARLGTVVVVVESSGAPMPLDRVLGLALRRPADSPMLADDDWAQIPGALQTRRTALRPDPLVECISVTPWSGASDFQGMRFARADDVPAAINQFVLRYDDEGQASEEVVRIRNQIDDCSACGAEGQLRARDLRAGHGGSGIDEGVVAEGRPTPRG